jgi:glutaredoxin
VTARVTLYTAQGCSLCGPVRRRLQNLRAEVPFEFEEVDITGVPVLEREYREWLPVVEIDGERAFVYRVDEDKLRALLDSSPA